MENLLSIILISVGILFIPFISRILNIPVSVGEILYGIVIGNSLLKLVEPSQWLDFLSSFGFLLLMFVAGLEVKFKEISRLPLKSKAIYILFPILTLTIAFSFGSKLGFHPIISTALGVISVGVVVSVLRERKLLGKRVGKTVFTAGIVGEVLSILFLTLITLHTEFGFGFDFWLGILKLFVYLTVARVVLLFLKSFVWWFPNRFKFFFEKNPSEIGVRISLAVMFMLSVAASAIHIEPIIGAFIAGVIFSTVFEETESIEEKLSGVSFGFLIPIFFMYIGINFQMPQINAEVLKMLFCLVVATIASKTVPSLLFILEGLTPKEAIAGGFLLSAPLTLVIVTAELGKELGVIDGNEESILILLAVVTGIMAPILFNLFIKEKNCENNNP